LTAELHDNLHQEWCQRPSTARDYWEDREFWTHHPKRREAKDLRRQIRELTGRLYESTELDKKKSRDREEMERLISEYGTRYEDWEEAVRTDHLQQRPWWKTLTDGLQIEDLEKMKDDLITLVGEESAHVERSRRRLGLGGAQRGGSSVPQQIPGCWRSCPAQSPLLIPQLPGLAQLLVLARVSSNSVARSGASTWATARAGVTLARRTDGVKYWFRSSRGWFPECL
jgi:hypothetical protein